MQASVDQTVHNMQQAGLHELMSILIDSRHSSKEMSVMNRGYRAKSTDHELGGVEIP